MNYQPDQWIKLCQEVERQSGALLNENDRCVGHALTYHIPKTKKTYQVKSCNCRMASMIVVPYEPSDNDEELEELRGRGSGFARVCAVCDDVGAWPRFAKALE